MTTSGKGGKKPFFITQSIDVWSLLDLCLNVVYAEPEECQGKVSALWYRWYLYAVGQEFVSYEVTQEEIWHKSY